MTVTGWKKEDTMLATWQRRLTALALVLALATTVGFTTSASSLPTAADDRLLRFDVAEDATRFIAAKEPAHEDGMPTHGASFISQGYIYPAGTLTETNGVNADGSPEFPDQVIGQWTCRGWFVGEGMHTTSGPWVVTTQLYNFGDTFGTDTLVSEGYEIADVGKVITRAISGGTGDHLGAQGQLSQTLLGFNASEGVNLSFEIEIAPE
jgi:hypothetical protein